MNELYTWTIMNELATITRKYPVSYWSIPKVKGNILQKHILLEQNDRILCDMIIEQKSIINNKNLNSLNTVTEQKLSYPVTTIGLFIFGKMTRPGRYKGARVSVSKWVQAGTRTVSVSRETRPSERLASHLSYP